MERYSSMSRIHIEGAEESDTAIRLYTSLMAGPKADALHLKETIDAFDRLHRPGLAIKACIQIVKTKTPDELKMPSVIRRLEAARKKRRGRVF